MKKWVILLLVSTMSGVSNGQTIKNLVMEGGGVRGLAYPGALIELEKAGLLDSVTQVAGTSSGGLNALLLCVGYRPEEMKNIVLEMKVHRLNQRGFPVISTWHRMNHKFGWYSSERLLGILEDLVEKQTNNPNMTFGQLRDSAVAHPFRYRDLFLTGTDLVSQGCIVFSHLSFPDMRIVDAARISMTIPLYFEAIFMDKDGRILESSRSMDSNTMIMVDGGLGLNYPIHIFDTLVHANPHALYLPNPETLGLKFEADEQIDYNIRGKGLAPVRIHKVTEFVNAFYNVSFEEINRSAMSGQDWERTIFIPTQDFSPRIRRLSTDDKQFLLENAAEAVTVYLNGN